VLEVFLSPEFSDWFWGQPSFPSSGLRGFSIQGAAGKQQKPETGRSTVSTVGPKNVWRDKLTFTCKIQNWNMKFRHFENNRLAVEVPMSGISMLYYVRILKEGNNQHANHMDSYLHLRIFHLSI
jgi:hypothetical protein